MSEQPISDGGSAFPSEEQIRCNGEVCDIRKFTGMTLRDYFAAHAINKVAWYENMDNSATMAYLIADAMLKAREAK